MEITGLGLALLLLCAYTCGRLHQWYLQGRLRDQAYQHGYDQATRAVLHAAAGAVTITPKPADRHAATGRHAAHTRDLEATTREIGQPAT